MSSQLQSRNQYTTSIEDAKLVARRLMERYDQKRRGNLQKDDMNFILKDIYSTIEPQFQPNSQEQGTFFSILDVNKDNQITLEDFERVCINILCPEESDISLEKSKHYSYYAQNAATYTQNKYNNAYNNYAQNTTTTTTVQYSNNNNQQQYPYSQQYQQQNQQQTYRVPSHLPINPLPQTHQQTPQNPMQDSTAKTTVTYKQIQSPTSQNTYQYNQQYVKYQSPKNSQQVIDKYNSPTSHTLNNPEYQSLINKYSPQNTNNYLSNQQLPSHEILSQNMRQVTSITTTSQNYLGGYTKKPRKSKALQHTLELFKAKITSILNDPNYLKQEDKQKVSFINTSIYKRGYENSIQLNQSKNLSNAKFNSKMLFSGTLSNVISKEKFEYLRDRFSLRSRDVVRYTPGPKQQQILQQCRMKNQAFIDPEFPPNLHSLSQTGVWYDGSPVPHNDWIRPKEYFKGKFELFDGGIMPGDIRQGELGDCYFQCTLAALAEWPERIQRIFSTAEKNEFGVYSMWIVWTGVKTEVVVDDNLWYSRPQGTIVSMRTQQNEIWAQLLEKAWAKLNGDYCKIDGGFARDCLHDLTGAPVIHYRIKEDQKWRKWEHILWQQLLHGEEADFVMTAGTYPGEDEYGNPLGDAYEKDGIYYSHAYSILAAYEVNVDGQTRNLIKFRNPHGEGEWRGPFSDKDPVWNRVSLSEKNRIGMSDEDDGVFFMEYSMLRNYYEDVQVCQYRDYYEYEGLRINTQNGEQPHFFEVQVPEEGHYFFQVNQKAKATFDEESNYLYTKATCNVVNSQGQVVSACQGRQKNITSYKNQQLYKEIPAGTYYVMASVNFDHHQQQENLHHFGFGVYGKGKVTIRELQQPPQQFRQQLLSATDEILPSFVI